LNLIRLKPAEERDMLTVTRDYFCAPMPGQTVGDTTGDGYLSQILHAADLLIQSDDRTPRNRQASDALALLAALALTERPEAGITDLLNHPEIRSRQFNLHTSIQAAEKAREAFFTNWLLTQTGTDLLSRLPFFAAADAFVQAELKAFRHPNKMPAIRTYDSIALVGSGALPITALLWARKTRTPVTCLEICPDAADLSRKLLHHLIRHDPLWGPVAEQIHVVTGCGSRHDYVTHPVTIVDAYVTPRDATVFHFIASSNLETRIAVRSTEGMGALCLPPYFYTSQVDYWLFYSRKSDCGFNTTDGLVQKANPTQTLLNTVVFKYSGWRCRSLSKPGSDWYTPQDVSGIDSFRKRRMKTQPDKWAI
jgi:hypothetical protein